jgi:hypothetical protein
MFERWLEYLDDAKQKVKEDAHAQALQQLADELASVKCVGEEGVAEEKERRREQAKRIDWEEMGLFFRHFELEDLH